MENENKQFENEGIIMKRIRHQLHIHWNWLRREKNADTVANYISCWFRQGLASKEKVKEEKNDNQN